MADVDPGFHLLAGARRIAPSLAGPGYWLFPLPPGEGRPRLVCRPFRPDELGRSGDSRRLGVALTRLRVVRDTDRICVEVDNDAPRVRRGEHGDALSTGHGLLGVRERVQAAGGTVRAGRTESGGFNLTVSLPVAPDR